MTTTMKNVLNDYAAHIWLTRESHNAMSDQSMDDGGDIDRNNDDNNSYEYEIRIRGW